jgi:hypothetical protein
MTEKLSFRPYNQSVTLAIGNHNASLKIYTKNDIIFYVYIVYAIVFAIIIIVNFFFFLMLS